MHSKNERDLKSGWELWKILVDNKHSSALS
jgi:hypothetical protein